MQSSESRTFAQFGGLLLIVSLALPYFAISFAGLGGEGFRLWTVDKGAFVLVAAYGALALSQISLSSRESMAIIYLVCGGIFTGALVYKIWISPPGSAAMDIPGGSMSYNGKSVQSVSAKDLLDALGIEMKASYGAYVAMLGSAFFTIGAFLEFRAAGASGQTTAAPTIDQLQSAANPQARYAPAAAAPTEVPPAQRYQAPPSHVGRPDPFATPPAPAASPAAPAAPAAPTAAAAPQQYRAPGPPAPGQ